MAVMAACKRPLGIPAEARHENAELPQHPYE